jgi:chromosome segregation ATPase
MPVVTRSSAAKVQRLLKPVSTIGQIFKKSSSWRSEFSKNEELCADLINAQFNIADLAKSVSKLQSENKCLLINIKIMSQNEAERARQKAEADREYILITDELEKYKSCLHKVKTEITNVKDANGRCRQFINSLWYELGKFRPEIAQEVPKPSMLKLFKKF